MQVLFSKGVFFGKRQKTIPQLKKKSFFADASLHIGNVRLVTLFVQFWVW
jgi:hypothetical protein